MASSVPELRAKLKGAAEQLAGGGGDDATHNDVDAAFEALVAQLNSVGMGSLNVGDNAEALRLLSLAKDEVSDESEHAAAVAAATRAKLKAVTFNNLGCLYKAMGRHHLAMQYCQAALDIEQQLPSSVGCNTASTHLNLCCVLSALKKHRAAYEHAVRALELINECKAATDGADARWGAQWGSLACVASYNMSIQLEALNRPRKALRALSDAINVATEELGANHPKTKLMRKQHKRKEQALGAAASRAKQREADVLGAYKALMELRAAGKIASIGVGAKDITAIDWIVDAGIKLDWAMFACSITPYSHGDVAKKLLKKLGAQGVDVINSAVFNGGFLTGGSFFDYREVTAQSDPELFAWRDKFNKICADFNVKPAAVCVQFSFLFPEIKSIALATSKPSRVNDNIALAEAVMPAGLWDKLEAEGLINLSEPK